MLDPTHLPSSICISFQLRRTMSSSSGEPPADRNVTVSAGCNVSAEVSFMLLMLQCFPFLISYSLTFLPPFLLLSREHLDRLAQAAKFLQTATQVHPMGPMPAEPTSPADVEGKFCCFIVFLSRYHAPSSRQRK